MVRPRNAPVPPPPVPPPAFTARLAPLPSGHFDARLAKGSGRNGTGMLDFLRGEPSPSSPIPGGNGRGLVFNGTDAVERTQMLGGTSAAGFVASIPNLQWLGALYRRLDENLNYPSELADAGIEGTVDVELHFIHARPEAPDLRIVRASSPYLRVLVLRTIRRILRPPLPLELKRLSTRQRVKARFAFAITEPQAQAHLTTKSNWKGHHFEFYRNVVHSATEWNAGPFGGHWIPAARDGMIMATVQIDTDWFGRAAKRMNNRTASDPLASYREDPAFRE